MCDDNDSPITYHYGRTHIYVYRGEYLIAIIPRR